MARKLRVEFPGAIYHVTLRGNGRRNVFRDDQDRGRFLHRLSESAATYNVRVYMFCLMSNHIHLVCETPQANVSRFMQSLVTGYTVYYNLKNNHAGHLFQGRFKAKLVEGDAYLLSLTRYVHLNPVFVDGVMDLPLKERLAKLNTYKWSSYGGYVDQLRVLEFVDYGPVLTMLDSRGERFARMRYRRFAEAGIAQSDDEFIRVKNSSPLSIGSVSFETRVQKMYDSLVDECRVPQDVAFRRQEAALAVDDVLTAVCDGFGVDKDYILTRQRGCMIRPVAALLLCRYSGLKKREVAQVMNLSSGAAVGSQIRKLQSVLTEDNDLEIHVERITAGLNELCRRQIN
jgi:putative transposase